MHAFNHIKDEPKKRKFCYFLRPAGHAPISIPVLKGLNRQIELKFAMLTKQNLRFKSFLQQ